jgi:hypothetical protein
LRIVDVLKCNSLSVIILNKGTIVLESKVFGISVQNWDQREQLWWNGRKKAIPPQGTRSGDPLGHNSHPVPLLTHIHTHTTCSLFCFVFLSDSVTVPESVNFSVNWDFDGFTLGAGCKGRGKAELSRIKSLTDQGRVLETQTPLAVLLVTSPLLLQAAWPIWSFADMGMLSFCLPSRDQHCLLPPASLPITLTASFTWLFLLLWGMQCCKNSSWQTIDFAQFYIFTMTYLPIKT